MTDKKPIGKKTPAKTIIFGILGFSVVIGGSYFLYSSKKTSSLNISYRSVKVGRSKIEVKILATGIVQPENRLEIKPPIPGRVTEVLVKEGDYVKKGRVLAWMSSTERAALIDAARAQGDDELKRWEEIYRPTPILAPINGTIILRNVEAGQTFASNDSVLVMSDRLTVKAQVDETDIAQIKLKQNARITLDAYPGAPISGRVDQIAFESKTVNNVTTYIVDVLPDKNVDFMRSGMTANVTFFISSKENVVSVPNEAIKVRGDSQYVLLKGESGAEQLERTIETGITDGKFTEITSGLVEGDTLLVAEFVPSNGKKTNSGNPFAPMGVPRRGGR